MSAKEEEPPAKTSRLGSPFFEAAGLNDTVEITAGVSSSSRPVLPNAPPTDHASIQSLSSGAGLTYQSIDLIALAGSGLYDFPALSTPGALATVAHVAELAPGMTLWIYEGEYWESPQTFVPQVDDQGVVIPDPKQAKLLAVYQCLDNATGASPRLTCLITHERFPLRAIMTATRHIFIGNLDGLAALGRLTLVPPMQLLPINSSIRSLAHGPRSAFAMDHGTGLHAHDHIIGDTPLGHASSVDSVASGRGIRVDTAATDELKQNLGLVLRTALFSRPAYRAIMGIMTNILNPEVAAAMRIRMPEHLKQAIALTDKYFFALMTGKYDNLATATSKQVSTTVSLAHALEHPETYDDLDPQGLAQCIDRFADLLQRTTNMHDTADGGTPSTAERQFYNLLVQPLSFALRGRGADSFENYDMVWVKDRFVQGILTAHRSAINMGTHQSAAALKADLEDIWYTNKGRVQLQGSHDKTSRMGAPQ